jgi:HSP20 family protein
MNAVTQEKQEAVTRAKRFVVPRVNIFEENEGYVLEAEMPGVNKSGLEITLEGNELTITGHRADEPIAGQALYRESRPADYRRAFELDPTVESSKISARMEQGILTLHLPKAEKVKPRKITIAD